MPNEPIDEHWISAGHSASAASAGTYFWSRNFSLPRPHCRTSPLPVEGTEPMKQTLEKQFMILLPHRKNKIMQLLLDIGKICCFYKMNPLVQVF
jgi:hypothetical protein